MKKTSIGDDLKQSGLKNTRCRCAVLEVMQQSDQPVTAETIYQHLDKKKISVSLSTIYRILEAFADKNLVTKLTVMCETKLFFEYNRRVHRHYLTCLGCKKILAIDNCPLKDYEESLKKETDYEISGHKLDIYGYCPKCRKKINTKK